MTLVWLLAGLLLGAGFLVFARSRYGKGAQTLALGLVVAAVVYVGFALWYGAAPHWLLLEGAGVAVYGAFAWLGLRQSVYWLAVGWALHVGWDVGLHLSGTGAAHAPEAYVWICVSFDLLVAAFVAGYNHSQAAAQADTVAG